jgi:hypothetical protein
MVALEVLKTARSSRVACLSFFLLLLTSRAVPRQATDLSAHEVLTKALDAQGGKESLDKVKTRVAYGKAQVLGGYSGSYESWARFPNKLKTKWDIKVISHEQAYDGTHGWEKLATVRQLDGSDLEREKRRSVFNPLLSFASENVPVALKGKMAIPLSAGFQQSSQIQIQQQGTANNSAGYTAAESNHDRETNTTETYVLEFSLPGGPREQFYFDSTSFLLLRAVHKEPYMEGSMEVTTNYGDYRPVGDVMLPFSISEVVPDLPVLITIDKYEINVPVAESVFENPMTKYAKQPFEMSLSTIPKHVYKEEDGPWSAGWQRYWGIPFPPTESWYFNVVVNEKYGRQVLPESATMEFYCGDQRCDAENFSREELAKTMKFPVNRFSPQPEIYDFRYNFSRPRPLGIDRVVYTLHAMTADGKPLTQSLSIPLTYYQLKHDYIFPLRGNFIVLDGHEYYELGHAYEWSQHYAYDVLGLGPNFELYAQGKEGCSAYYGFEREILAPADGVVAYARDDVPDMMPIEEYLKLPDPQYAIGGNIILLDHGGGEVSLFAHTHHESVRVRTGDTVKQGQVIALMGCSGSPGLTHLHYQLQAGPGLFSADGLPVRFENLELVRWLNEGEKIAVPKRGVYLNAK